MSSRKSLGFALLRGTLLSLSAAVVVFMMLQAIFFDALDRYTMNSDFVRRTEQSSLSSLKGYVATNNVSATDSMALTAWLNENRSVLLFVTRNDQILFSSGLPLETGSVILNMDGVANTNPTTSTYSVNFQDGQALVYFWPLFEHYYGALLFLSGVISFGVFVLVFLLLIRRKTREILRLAEELKILESGDLCHEVTVKGDDELAELARGVNDMRLSILEREERAASARAANHALVTAMSHDLRSPLTALIGYLDLLALDKCGDPERQKHFLESSRRKAYQIKEMSDKLFEYFLVYDENERRPALQPVSSMELFGQTIEEGLFDLENRGFSVERDAADFSCQLRINVDLFRRLCDNLFGNILKYADPCRPVAVHYRLTEDALCLTLHNFIRPVQSKVESTEIGLKTCEKILRDHGGSFTVCKSDDDFSATACFPLS